MNLVGNAIDAIGDESGEIEIRTGYGYVDRQLLQRSLFAGDADSGRYLYLSVKDTGSGIQPSDIARIFDPFYSGKDRGRGLGLSSLSGIVRQHDGFIHVESGEGRGTRFTVYFPVATQDVGTDENAGSGHSARHNRGRILVAEHDPRIRGLITSILESDGYATIPVQNGEEALKHLLGEGHDCVLAIIDGSMGEVSGTEVHARLRASGEEIPLVLVSGDLSSILNTGIRNDARVRCVKKPFDIDDILDTVHGLQISNDKERGKKIR